MQNKHFDKYDNSNCIGQINKKSTLVSHINTSDPVESKSLIKSTERDLTFKEICLKCEA